MEVVLKLYGKEAKVYEDIYDICTDQKCMCLNIREVLCDPYTRIKMEEVELLTIDGRDVVSIGNVISKKLRKDFFMYAEM